jgi:predicted PurR-regulated permease PerM
MTKDRIRDLFRERTFSRVFALALFLGGLFLFRHLWPTFVFFVIFERAFGFLSEKAHQRFRWPKKYTVLGAAAVFLLTLAGLVAFGAVSGFHQWKMRQDTSVEWIEELKRHALYEKVQSAFGEQVHILQYAKEYAGQAIKYVGAIGRFFVQATIGFVLGIVYRLEAHELDKFEDNIPQDSLPGRLLRWAMHVIDAVSVTIQLQLVVALFNAVTTLPVLILLGIPHLGSLMALIFVSGLIPVVGNLVAGTVLCILAFQAKGWLGVILFVVVTFLLHKIESYYLSPRLTARHVKVPGFVLIVSLIAFEHLFGIVGVFLSFPSLFVAARIRAEFIEEEKRNREISL